MTVAFVLGNGVSRQNISLPYLKLRGKIYGCNALYKEFAPDALIATDKPIAEQIQKTGYALTNKFYTRKPMAGQGGYPVPQQYYGYSSGPIAAAVACEDGAKTIYLLGFDMGPAADNHFNNIYANTEFYKPTGAPPTFSITLVRSVRKDTVGGVSLSVIVTVWITVVPKSRISSTCRWVLPAPAGMVRQPISSAA